MFGINQSVKIIRCKRVICITVYDCRMIVWYKIFRHFPAIFLDLFCNRVFGKSLLQKQIGTQYCFHSISIDEEKLKKAICRALNKIIENKQEAMDLIMTNLSYAVTGDDDVLYISSIENQLKELDDTFSFVANFAFVNSSSCRNTVICLHNSLIICLNRSGSPSYDEITVRRLVEYIRVMSDGRIIVVLKGGMSVYFLDYSPGSRT